MCGGRHLLSTQPFVISVMCRVQTGRLNRLEKVKSSAIFIFAQMRMYVCKYVHVCFMLIDFFSAITC